MGLFTERIACLLERTAMGERQIRGLSLRPLDKHFFTYPGQRVPTSESTPAMTVKSFACQMNFNHRPMMRVAGTVALTSLVVPAFTTMPTESPDNDRRDSLGQTAYNACRAKNRGQQPGLRGRLRQAEQVR
jgi:hypothetical protein